MRRKRNKILITGHRGFIGSHLAELFQKFDGIDLKDGKDICKHLPDVNYTHIFHLASFRSVPVGEIKYEEFVRNNCLGITRLVKKYPEARIINVSSSSANDVKSVYGATKLFSELIGELHKNCLSVRLYNVFGERQPLESGAVVPQFINAVLSHKRPVIYGDGEQQRDMTYVKDVVLSLNYLMFETDITGMRHIGYASPISVNHLYGLICGLAGKDIKKPIYKPARSFDILYSNAGVLMPQPHYGRRTGLRRTVEYFKSRVPACGRPALANTASNC